MASLIFCAIWILLAGSFFFGGLRGEPVPFFWLFWSTNLTRAENKVGFWLVLVCWLALFLAASAGFLLTCVRALTGQPPFDHHSFWPSSLKDVLATIIFSLLLLGLAWLMYRRHRFRVLLRNMQE